jgi:hypothetical protein
MYVYARLRFGVEIWAFFVHKFLEMFDHLKLDIYLVFYIYSRIRLSFRHFFIVSSQFVPHASSHVCGQFGVQVGEIFLTQNDSLFSSNELAKG